MHKHLTDVTINNHKSYFNPDICSHSYCSFASSRGKIKYSILSIGCYFARQIDEVWLRIELYRKVATKYQITSFGAVRNFCNFSQVKTNNYFMDFLLNFGEKYIRNIRCPLSGNVTVNNLPTMLQISAAFLPPAEYLMSSVVSGDKSIKLKIVEFNISFTVIQNATYNVNYSA
ncbi:uncharacterized protein LOC118743983 [Rhagoletis pomonella]|uniref:uncharacterized protein LOC118743983 n=1 Tax=Rhagoletis pomonella TaxID=28610 RepID=UPI0017830F3F|nr:uncharacterized protein LOC118743983 [Rhagoletis pomonella]